MHATSPTLSPIATRTARQEIALTVAEGVPSLVERLAGAFMSQERPERALSALRRFTVEGLTVALLRGRFHFPIDAPVFRLCGRASTAAGVELDPMIEAMEEAAEALRDGLLIPAARMHELEFGAASVDAAITCHCKTLDDFTREAYRQLLAAFVEGRQG